MAAFDVTTKPTSLSLKPGSTGSIMVVVSNRLGRPVMGFVEGVITPASAARWVVPPPDQQRPYPADPAATMTHEFKIAVPEDVPAQVAHFRASARDVLAPDDTRSDGQTVAINITRDPVEEKKRKPWPWWLWVILAVLVLAGAAVGIWLALKPEKTAPGVPDVVGTTAEDARVTLRQAGFAPINITDTLKSETAEDTNKVVRQEPLPGSELPRDTMVGRTPAMIVVSRPAGRVPDVVGLGVSLAAERLLSAGLQVGANIPSLTNSRSLDGRVASSQPPAGTLLPRGSAVHLIVYKYLNIGL